VVRTKHPKYNVEFYERGRGLGPSVYKNPTPSEILYDQLFALKNEIKAWPYIKTIFREGSSKVNLQAQVGRKKPVYITIKYSPGRDTYDVRAFEITKSWKLYRVYEAKDVYVSQLPDIIDGVVLRGWRGKRVEIK